MVNIETMRLKRSSPDSPGIKRERRGRGFRYVDASGRRVTEPDTLARITELAIPPAWRKVWICPYPHGHLQAIGYDQAERRQYLYHARWRQARDEEKYDRVLALGRSLAPFRDAVKSDLDSRGLGKDRVLAAALRLLDLGVFRTGNEEYTEENETHGVATLLREHVRFQRNDILFRYRAKGGITRAIRIQDELLFRTIKALRKARSDSDRLLVYRATNGWQEVHAQDINERFKDLTGDEFTAKDLRTWNATVFAAVEFAGQEQPASQRGLKRTVSAVMKEVAEKLGNTPTIAKNSYVDPRVIKAFEQGQTVQPAVRRADKATNRDQQREVIERAVIRLLRGQ